MAEADIAIAILAGGQGSRFWPISRYEQPKQFLSLGESGKSMIQATVARLEKLVPRDRMVVITAAHLVPLIEEHCPGIAVLAEPCGRNTAAAMALGARWLESQSFDGVMIALPADHAVESDENLVTTLRRAVGVAYEKDKLVTVGIVPERPDTAYGYIQKGAGEGEKIYQVKRFYEKPSMARAVKYLESGDFFWNSGMFAWKPSVFLSALEEFLPDMHASFMKLQIAPGKLPANDDLEDLYENIESISVDFGIMEFAKNVSVVEAEPYGWNDVGSWDAWAEHFDKDDAGNILHGDCIAIEGSGNIVSADNRFVALVGADDLVVIDSGDALLICPRTKVQEVKKVVEHLKAEGRDELI